MFRQFPIWPGLDRRDQLEDTRRRSRHWAQERRKNMSHIETCPKCGYPMITETRWTKDGQTLVKACVNSLCLHQEPID